jgi:hypothetical protein
MGGKQPFVRDQVESACRSGILGPMLEGPFRPLDDERAARIAAKRTKRQREQFPLFADQLPVVTADAVKAAADRHAQRFAACLQMLQERGDAFRERVRDSVSAETFAELERRQSRLPQTAEYHADFWRQQWTRLGVEEKA